MPAFGSFTGTGATGDVCLGGAFAVVQEVPATDETPSQTLLVIATADTGDPSALFHFQSPADAVTGSLALVVGLPAATAGHFSSAAGACGTLELCATSPPAVVDWGDAAAPTTCPAGCDIGVPGGPCTPNLTQACFVAGGTSDCAGTATTPVGSWEMTLASLTPYPGDASSEPELAAHGVLRATLAGDAGPTTITLGF